MGRSDYLVSAGIGFDLDRSSAKKSIGIFEGIADTLNAVQSKKESEAFAQTETAYGESIKKIEKKEKKAKKIGMKVAGDTQVNLKKFAKKDVESRKRLINLNKRMIKDEKEKMKHLKKGTRGYADLEKEVLALTNQQKALENVLN